MALEILGDYFLDIPACKASYAVKQNHNNEHRPCLISTSLQASVSHFILAL